MRQSTTKTHDDSWPLAHFKVRKQEQHEIAVDKHACFKPFHGKDRGVANLQKSVRCPVKYPTMLKVEHNMESNNVIKEDTLDLPKREMKEDVTTIRVEPLTYNHRTIAEEKEK